jgi:hypothetical protein
MPLQLPNLDDRRYNDLVGEALTLIPTYAPQWTNHNPSDPGITLIELFAFLTDMLLYRLNRVTDDNTRKFLKLLNPDWVETAGADLRDEIRAVILGVRELYRAVTAKDYEVLSTEKFNQWLIDRAASQHPLQPPVAPVARAHCVPQRNLLATTEAGRRKLQAEHVSLVIVPGPDGGAAASSPQPSADQIHTLFSFLDERRMLTTKLHITGPFYVHVTVEAVVARNSDAVADDVFAAINASLKTLLNPLPSSNGQGWPFGRDVYVSEVYDTLESIQGIDFITDVVLKSTCAAGDDKCVVAKPIWHAEGDLVGLRIEEHYLPIFDKADIVIAPSTAFIKVKFSVSATISAGADDQTVKSAIKSAVRDMLRPAPQGPGPIPARQIAQSAIETAIKNIAIENIKPVVTASVKADSIPADALQTTAGQWSIQLGEGNVADWQVTIELS